MSSHAMLAGLTGTPELAIDDTEANELAKAALEVQSHYKITGLDDKTIAWLNLAQVAGLMYGFRFMAIRVRKQNEKKSRASMQQRAQASAIVTREPMPQMHQPEGAQQPPNGAQRPLKAEERRVDIPGVGPVEFPEDHPLAQQNKTVN